MNLLNSLTNFLQTSHVKKYPDLSSLFGKSPADRNSLHRFSVIDNSVNRFNTECQQDLNVSPLTFKNVSNQQNKKCSSFSPLRPKSILERQKNLQQKPFYESERRKKIQKVPSQVPKSRKSERLSQKKRQKQLKKQKSKEGLQEIFFCSQELEELLKQNFNNPFFENSQKIELLDLKSFIDSKVMRNINGNTYECPICFQKLSEPSALGGHTAKHHPKKVSNKQFFNQIITLFLKQFRLIYIHECLIKQMSISKNIIIFLLLLVQNQNHFLFFNFPKITQII